jgi:hypothetical protein
VTRWLLGALGLALTAYGAVLLLGTGWSNTVAAALWLAGGVVLHDAVLAPATLAAGLLLVRVVPSSWRGTVVAALAIVGTLTIVAIPVLGRFGARADNPTLLDRPYLPGWLALVVVITAGAVVVRLVTRRPWHARTSERRDHGTRPGGR